jgi:large subunit ribosomal protein L5
MRLNELTTIAKKKEFAKSNNINVMNVPAIEKITINVGLGKFREDKEALKNIKKEIEAVFGQSPKWTASKKSISGFKLREGQLVGYCLTLRGKRMWDFLERLVKVSLPRLRDFDGISVKKFDSQGNITIGITDQTIFTEIKPDEIKQNWGMSVTVTMKNADNRELVTNYLKQVGFIFREGE